MNRTKRRRAARPLDMSRKLALAALAVLLIGTITLIVVRVRVSAQSKALARVQKQIKTMDANADNLNRYIGEYHDLDDIAKKAQALGMQQPEEDQLRVVAIPALDDTQAQTVDSGESAAG